jgi:hypothetical protein
MVSPSFGSIPGFGATYEQRIIPGFGNINFIFTSRRPIFLTPHFAGQAAIFFDARIANLLLTCTQCQHPEASTFNSRPYPLWGLFWFSPEGFRDGDESYS